MWKALISSFGIIGDLLSWDVGNDKSIRIGFDSWIENPNEYRLPPNMCDFLLQKGIIFLHHGHDYALTTPFQQSWLNATWIVFTVEEAIIWDNYIQKLMDSKIHIIN